MQFDIVHDVTDVHTFDYFLYVDPCGPGGESDDWTEELVALCPALATESGCNLALYDVEDRERIKSFVEQHGLWYLVVQSVRAMEA